MVIDEQVYTGGRTGVMVGGGLLGVVAVVVVKVPRASE